MRPTVLNPLFAETASLKGIGPKLAALIGRVAGPNVVDVLFLRPASLIDRRTRPMIANAPLGEIVTLDVEIGAHDPPKRPRQPYRVACSDESGHLTLTFFKPRPDFLEKALPVGGRRLISGRIDSYSGALQMTHPDYIVDPQNPLAMPLIEPVYPLTAGLTNSVMRRATQAALGRTPDLPEWLDPAFKRAQNWPSWRVALLSLHTPQSPADLDSSAPARRRLAYDELLANQLALALVRASHAGLTGLSLIHI
jgi:ATP-dependent DNA helicase RecG